MALAIHPVLGKQKSIDICNAFVQGAPRGSMGHVFYGVDASNVKEWDRVRKAGATWYYIDNSYFDRARGDYFRVTRNAVQHSGAGDSDGKRFDALHVEIKPWRRGGEYALFCPQSDSFMTHVAKHKGDWLAEHLEFHARLFPEIPARVRAWNRDKRVAVATLEDDLERAAMLVTYSSAAAVTAVLGGVGVHAHPTSPAHMRSAEALTSNADRRQWAGVLADNQFTINEMKEGKAWAALHQ
jgi:hypothetical protein